MSKLSDLELAILGVVWKRRPCTAYIVAREFVTSPSSHWSGSAGAIYPAMERLRRGGYLSAEAAATGRRKRLDYSLTRKGLTALQKWLTPPLPTNDARLTVDPLRTRSYFLASLPEERRRAFAVDALRQLREQIKVVDADVERYEKAGDPFSALASRGAALAMRARVAWIEELLEVLDHRKPQWAPPNE